jgi:proline dehydrogenase
MAAGFLEVIDRLAGCAPHIAVATHDLRLASEAIARIRAAGTSCELELLLGAPCKPLLRWASENGVKARIYVPFGEGFVPNAIGLLKQNPQLMWTIAKSRLIAVTGKSGTPAQFT